MKRINSILFSLAILALLAAPALGQTALFSTTVTEAVDDSERRIDIAATTDVDAGDVAFIDFEAMLVLAVDSTALNIDVRRGYAGTYAEDHASGQLIWIDEPDRFIHKNLYGSCVTATEYPTYTPLINVGNGNMYRCTNSRWVRVQHQELYFADSGARDFLLTLDGNAADFSIGIDDSADDLVIAMDATLGTDNIVAFPAQGTTTSGQRAIFYGEDPASVADNDESYISFFTEDDAAAQVEIGRLTWVALDTSAADDDSEIQFDTFVNNTFTRVLSIGSQDNTAPDIEMTIGSGGAVDTIFTYDGTAQDYHIALDDSADDLVFGLGATPGTTTAFAIDENQATTFTGGVTLATETTTAVDTLTAAQCGLTVFLNNATGYATTLPAPVAGCQFRFILVALLTSGNHTIVTNAGADLMIGGCNELEVDTSNDGPIDTNGDTFTIVGTAESLGDLIEFISDGTSWYVTFCQAGLDDAFTFTTT